MSTLIRRFGLAILVLGLAAAAFAGPQRVATPIPGPVAYPMLSLGPASFQVQDCAWQDAYLDYDTNMPSAAFRVHEGSATVSLAAPVHLPEGAVVTGITVNYFDNDLATEPAMGLYAIDQGGLPVLIADASGVPGFAKGENTVFYKVTQMTLPAGTPYEFLVTLNRSVADPTIEHQLFRVQISYRVPSPTLSRR